MNEPTLQDVRRALETGHSGEAVRAASRLVEQLTLGSGPETSTGLAEAMTLLALAFDADGDPGGAEKIAPLAVAAVSAARLSGAGPQLADLSAELCLTVGEIGDRAWREGRVADAVRLYRDAIELSAEDVDVRTRRRSARFYIGAAEGLARLQRWDELVALGSRCVDAYGHDADFDASEAATVVACMGAQALLALGRPDDALRLARSLLGSVPEGHPNRLELNVRVGLALAAAELETHGSQAAEVVYSTVLSDLRTSSDPGTRVFLAIALEMECAMLCQLERMDEAAGIGRELAQVIAGFPADEDFPTAAECANRAAERLISYADVNTAATVAGTVTAARRDRLAGDNQAVLLRGYMILFDALRRSDQGAELARCWEEILELDEGALVVLDGLVEGYRGHPLLRAALVDSYLGRVVVLMRLERAAEAEQAVAEILAEFGADEDPQIQLMLRGLRGE